MRISDWSSDVCSSDLASRPVLPQPDSTALRHAAPVAQMVVEQQREADLPFRPSVAHAGNDERHRPGQMRCRIEDDGPFVQRLFYEAENAEPQIAQRAEEGRGGKEGVRTGRTWGGA